MTNKTTMKKEIYSEKILLDILPEILDEKRKLNKIRNLIYAMSKKDQTIVNKGTTRYPKWGKV
jgi:ATP-dependent DNA helicase RecG